MREETVLLKGQDGATIRAVYTRGASRDAVVYFPFFMGNHRNATPHQLAQTLPTQYSKPWVIIIDPCVALKGYRSLSGPGMTLKTHVDDLRVVLAYFREKMGVTGKIHLIGHSVGAFVAVEAGADESLGLASATLLDGSDPAKMGGFAELYGLVRYRGKPLPGMAKKLFFSLYGPGLAMSASYLHDLETFNIAVRSKGWSLPTLVIAAGQGTVNLTGVAHKYAHHLRPSRLVIIDEADHFFVDESVFRELAGIVGRWVQGDYLAA